MLDLEKSIAPSWKGYPHGLVLDDARRDIGWVEGGWDVESGYEVEPSVRSWEPVPPLLLVLWLASLEVECQGTAGRVVVEVLGGIPNSIAVDWIAH